MRVSVNIGDQNTSTWTPLVKNASHHLPVGQLLAVLHQLKLLDYHRPEGPGDTTDPQRGDDCLRAAAGVLVVLSPFAQSLMRG